MQVIQIIEELFRQPPVAFDPAKSTLKAWIMFCLRDRGFKVVYAERGDFAIEMRGGEKMYFRITENPTDLNHSVTWIVRDPSTNQISVIPPQKIGE